MYLLTFKNAFGEKIVIKNMRDVYTMLDTGITHILNNQKGEAIVLLPLANGSHIAIKHDDLDEFFTMLEKFVKFN